MAVEVLRDPRLREVVWRDLCLLTRRDIVSELLISFPWLILSLVLTGYEYYFLALGASFMFFLCGLRQVHNAYHYAIGLSRQGHEWIMFVLSIVMLGSMHAVQYCHLQHHSHCLEEEDVEAGSAHMVWWQALLYGPIFPWILHNTALKKGSKQMRRWIYAELVANVIWIGLVFFVLNSKILMYHVIVMFIAQNLTAFFAVWTVHHDCDFHSEIGRTIRNKIKIKMSYNMFFHVEHHLFPAVPTRHLHTLAHRLDEVAPDLTKRMVF